ncbi:MAG: HAMP domain-containing histidine kinase [Lachnospiraceae bacterium]|nr:HAMP domain-containing histidine kinase [Lachnospiraceae bacterium]
MKASIIISLLGILAVFGLVIIFSNRVVEPAKLAYDKQRRFITDSSHEIKTPLAVISANTEVIEMLNGESEWTRSIRKQVDRLAELNSSLTELARLEEVNKKVNMTQVNLSQLLIEVVKPFNAMLEQNEKELLMDIDENVQYVCEKSEIKQLIGIYMDNASKYSKTFVKISLKKPNSKIKLIVENDSAGIEKGKQEKVFERFYRMDEARNNEVQGFGIGLSIAKSIVDKHNGKVNAVSDDGNIFRITTTLN